MKDNNKQHDDDRDNQGHYCCCCCYCCCYNSHQQNSKESNYINPESSESLPPWLLPPPTTNSNDRLSPNIESVCSYCSCSSSIEETKLTTIAVAAVEEEEEYEEDEEDEAPSTGCTTPIDLKVIEGNNTSSVMEKTRKKKLHAIEELLQTERDYVQDLSHLVEVCLEVISRQHWITTEHKSIIIRNSYDILSFHKQFIICFDTLENHGNSSEIAKKFIDQMDRFSLYKYYCDMHAEAWTLASEYRDRPEWNIFLKDCTILDSHSISLNLNHLLLLDDNHQMQQQQQQKKLHFEDYLIKPVQRICRYQLLIKEILKYTSVQTSEYDLWSIVLSEMQDVVSDIDNRKLERDMKEKTDKFIDRLEGDWRISKRHVSQLGSILIAGAIEVTYSALGQTVSKPRYLGCFVFQTYVIMVRPKKVTSYEPKHWFPLRMTEFEDLADIEGQREHSFILRCKKHAFAFSASCSQEKQLWVKKIQEAIIAAKIEASDDNLSAQDFIVSSLSGITSKRSPQSIRLSKSFTNLLDMTLAANNEVDKKSNSAITAVNSNSAFDRKSLRRSASTSIHFEDIMKMTMEHPPLPISQTISNFSSTLNEDPIASGVSTTNTNNLVSLKKRYSADYSAYASRQHQQLGLKPRNNSEMYIKPDSFGSSSGFPRRRPSSLDLLSAANNTSNMIGKMSSQLKSNHQNALRVTVDHKLRDVCTQEYLSSRAWHVRDRDAATSNSPSPFYHYQPSPATDTAMQSQMTNGTTTVTSTTAILGTDAMKKRKSTSFIRSSASSFSIIIPKRASESKSNMMNSRYQSEYEMQSNASSCSSSVVDRSCTPVNNNASRRPSQSSQLLRKLSENNRGCISESPISFDNGSSVSSSNNDKRIERSPSRRQIFVGKVLRRIASFHQKPPSSPTSFDRSSSSTFNIGSEEVEKAASVGTKRNKMRWKRHEELVQLQVAVNERPLTPSTINSDSSHFLKQQQRQSLTFASVLPSPSPSPQPPATIPIAAFAYASTPPSTPTNIPRKNSSNNINRSWKNRLSLIRPVSFLRVNSSNNSSSIHDSSFNNSNSHLS